MEEDNSLRQYDVVVVGGGIVGSSTAYHLAKNGHKTLLLEQFDFLHHRGSSHGESRTIRATYKQPYYCDLVLESSKIWEEAEAEIGYKVYFKTTHFDMGPSDDKNLLSLMRSCSVNGYPFEKLEPAAVRDKFTGKISMPNGWVGVASELGGVLKATKAVTMFQTLASRNSAMLMDNTEVTSIVRADKGGIWVYTAGGGMFWGKKCVIAAGGWTGKLLKIVAGIHLPVETVETSVHYWRIKEGYEVDFTIDNGFPTFASHGRPYIYGTPALEYPGLIKVAIHGGQPCDPDKRVWGNQESSNDSIREWIKETFGGKVVYDRPAFSQLCMYTMTPDEDFVIDFLGGEFGNDVVVGGGFSGHGFKMGPVLGRILADMAMTGATDDVDLCHFSISRFHQTELLR